MPDGAETEVEHLQGQAKALALALLDITQIDQRVQHAVRRAGVERGDHAELAQRQLRLAGRDRLEQPEGLCERLHRALGRLVGLAARIRILLRLHGFHRTRHGQLLS